MTTTGGSGAVGGARLANLKGLKVDYNTELAKNLIQGYGSRFDWYNAMVCPCSLQQEDGKFRRINCDLCNGTGWTYVFNKEIVAVPYGMSRPEETLPYRVANVGQLSNLYANLTLKPEDKVNIRDRVIFKESTSFRSEIRRFEQGTTTYRLTFPVVELLRILDVSGKQYDVDNYYVDKRDAVVQDGNIIWQNNEVPAGGTGFSVLYTFNPSYLVISAAHEIRGFMAGGTKPEDRQVYESLPRTVRIKLELPSEYLFRNE